MEDVRIQIFREIYAPPRSNDQSIVFFVLFFFLFFCFVFAIRPSYFDTVIQSISN